MYCTTLWQKMFVYHFSMMADEKMNASLKRAASESQVAYQTDEELTAFSSLDAVDWEDSEK
ncbi:MAG: hypothetical protein KIS88_09985 [Anaerolineales bacterium]|nr:hypothetical protein [Anaerolineales bacterium]